MSVAIVIVVVNSFAPPISIILHLKKNPVIYGLTLPAFGASSLLRFGLALGTKS
jgi:hypothetical protein